MLPGSAAAATAPTSVATPILAAAAGPSQAQRQGIAGW